MKINFIVPALNNTGGIRVVAIYASYLADAGHEVNVISPNKRNHTIRRRISYFLKGQGWSGGAHFSSAFFTNPKVNVQILNKWRPVDSSEVPDADIVIATFWNTAEWVNSYPSNKGKKIYFIQHYEVHPWLPIDRVKATLNYNFKKIVVSNWIKQVLENNFLNQSSISVVPNGVDLNQFYSGERNKQKEVTVGFFYSEREFKGCTTINEAIRIARKTYPELRVVAMGMKKPEKVIPLPKNTIFYENPPQDKIKEIYSKCDVWLFGSKSEGFGLTILEAMACKTPVIGTKAGAAPELLAGAGNMLVDIDDSEEMAKMIIKIIEMSPSEWLLLSKKSLEVATNNDWVENAKKFEKELVCSLY